MILTEENLLSILKKPSLVEEMRVFGLIGMNLSEVHSIKAVKEPVWLRELRSIRHSTTYDNVRVRTIVTDTDDEFSYDYKGRLISKKSTKLLGIVHYDYNANGDLHEVVFEHFNRSPETLERRVYDETNRLKLIIKGNRTTTYNYNFRGLIQSTVVNDRTSNYKHITRYVYDEIDRLTAQLTTPHSSQTTYLYIEYRNGKVYKKETNTETTYLFYSTKTKLNCKIVNFKDKTRYPEKYKYTYYGGGQLKSITCNDKPYLDLPVMCKNTIKFKLGAA